MCKLNLITKCLYLFSGPAAVAVYFSPLLSFIMKKTVTIAIAVTVTTPNTPRAAISTDDDDPLLSHAGTVLTRILQLKKL